MKEYVELRNVPNKGEGVFAKKPFKEGEIVMIGTIERILHENHSHASQIGENQYALYAGLVIKVNHSCDPNCGLKTNPSGAHDLVAIKAIDVDEEITLDYAMRNYSIEFFPMQCICGSEKCRKRITGWKDLPEAKKKEYGNFFPLYLLELDAKHSSANSETSDNL